MLFRIFFTVGFCLIVIGAKAQTKKFLSNVKNDKIIYGIVRNYPSLFNDGQSEENLPLKTVGVFDEHIHVFLKKYGKDRVITWLVSLLDDPKRDWAANLYLYFLFNKSAILIEAECSTEEAWRKNCAEEDIAYWKDKETRTTD